MRMLPVESSMLAMVGYNKSSENLIAQFQKDGALFLYKGVPEGVFVSVVTAESQGQAFDQFVKKGGFVYERIGPEDVLTL